MPITTQNMDYSRLAPAAIEAATKLVASIPDSTYIHEDIPNSSQPFSIARWRAISIGHLATTILQTMQFRDEMGGSVEVDPAQAQASATAASALGTTAPAGMTVNTRFEKLLTLVMQAEGVPPCTTSRTY